MTIFKKIKSFLNCDSEKAVLNHLLEESYPKLYRLAFAWTHQQHLSEDLVQEMMVKALENIEKLDDLSNLEPWLCKILHNLYIDRLRDNNKWQWSDSSLLDEQESGSISIEQQAIKEQSLSNMQLAMSQLTVEHRTVISLVDLQGLSYQQTASILDIPQGTVMSRLARARQALKSFMFRNEKSITAIRKIK